MRRRVDPILVRGLLAEMERESSHQLLKVFYGIQSTLRFTSAETWNWRGQWESIMERNASGGIFQDSAVDRLLAEHLPQVRYLARHIHEHVPHHQVALDDLVHSGIVGLMDALRKFDQRKQVQFKTYAKFRIRGAILDSLRAMDWSPRVLRRKGRAVRAATSRLGCELGREPNESELASDLGMSLEEYQHLVGELSGLDIGSLQNGSGEKGTHSAMPEQLAGPPDENPYTCCLESEIKRMLADAICKLTAKEQQVLLLYYYDELTMRDIGEVLGVGESRVSQIHSLVILKLRAKMPNTSTPRPQITRSRGISRPEAPVIQ